MQKGFTLIELVVVIIILGVLAVTAAPKFIDLSEDADSAVFSATYGAFRQAVAQSHLCWRLRGNNQAVDNLNCSNDATYNLADYNDHGYPVGTLENGGTKSIGNEHDCILVWDAILDTDLGVWSESETRTPAVSKADAKIQSKYVGNESCEYIWIEDDSLSFEYDSVSGEVVRL